MRRGVVLSRVRAEPGRRKWKRIAQVGFGALAVFALLPNSIGSQDLGALLARQPAVTERAREHLIASPFGTIHAAMFNLPRPVGTAIPHPPVYALANFDPTAVATSIGSQYLGDPNAPLRFPTVNRRDKRDSLTARARAPLPPLPPLLPIAPVPEAQVDNVLSKDAPRFDPYSQYEFATAPDDGPARGNDLPSAGRVPGAKGQLAPAGRATEKAKDASRVFFGADPLAPEQETISPWAAGEAPVVMALGDPDIKQSALVPAAPGAATKSGESVANKGEVTGIDKRPRSPAERLALAGAARAKAEKCLANAVYFEARDEPVRAQIAVAQVVLNRVFSPFYPNDVCGVVYQNVHRRLACQFTFACDGIPDVVTEPSAWARAQRIAHDILDGKLWMPDVAKSTHYHDDWAHPNWVGEMRRMDKLGGLIFYRPRNWGDGANEPRWGDAKQTAEEVKKL
jgi:spore germination cell wall hydrolase CwlJ-like protein